MVEVYRRFGDARCLHHQGEEWLVLMMEAVTCQVHHVHDAAISWKIIKLHSAHGARKQTTKHQLGFYM
jgi:hypothetical protein